MISRILQRMRDNLDTLETEMPETDEVIDACEMIREGLERLTEVSERKDTE